MRPEHVLNTRIGSEVSYDHQQVNKINKFDEKQTLELKSSFTSLDLNLLCTEEDQFTKQFHGVTSMKNQGNKDYIEAWFQSVFGLQHHFILHQILAPSFQGKLISHILEFIKLYFSIGSISILDSFLQKWIHCKFSYT